MSRSCPRRSSWSRRPREQRPAHRSRPPSSRPPARSRPGRPPAKTTPVTPAAPASEKAASRHPTHKTAIRKERTHGSQSFRMAVFQIFSGATPRCGTIFAAKGPNRRPTSPLTAPRSTLTAPLPPARDAGAVGQRGSDAGTVARQRYGRTAARTAAALFAQHCGDLLVDAVFGRRGPQRTGHAEHRQPVLLVS